ncbi:MAG: hypothetical protein WD114_03630 [Phycisphaerales bacterium]
MNKDQSKRLPVRGLAGMVGALVGVSALAAGSALAQSGTDQPQDQVSPCHRRLPRSS